MTILWAVTSIQCTRDHVSDGVTCVQCTRDNVSDGVTCVHVTMYLMVCERK